MRAGQQVEFAVGAAERIGLASSRPSEAATARPLRAPTGPEHQPTGDPAVARLYPRFRRLHRPKVMAIGPSSRVTNESTTASASSGLGMPRRRISSLLSI